MDTTSRPERRPRTAGVLLHPTSLPGPHGIGDLGPAAHAWIDSLARAQQTWWQVLPLGPTGFGDSPYQCFSAFAGNINLLSPEALVEDGLVPPADLPGWRLPPGPVDYDRAGPLKNRLVTLAWQRFQSGAAPRLHQPFTTFCAQEAFWLDDFALFMAIKESLPPGSWSDWPAELALRRPDALDRARRELADTIGRHQFGQFLFARQWHALKEHAVTRGVRLIGDLPIFVALDSADVWSRPELFLLDEQCRPCVVAGVPPDYFSATGQRWGNPLYNWEAMRRDEYAWWTARLKKTLEQVDLVRVDHFRGFQASWQVQAACPTAEVGAWVEGPGADLFVVLRRELEGLPLIAEDLGVITPEVEALREQFGLPGMRILQFAFGGAVEERFLPHNYERNTVVYTGTHDNDTTVGWFAALTDAEVHALRRYAPHVEKDIAWGLIRLAWASVADLAVCPLQDVLGLGSTARMNRPGISSGNWRWRIAADAPVDEALGRLADLTRIYQREPGAAKVG